jgi:hypothetical protein
MAGSFKHEADWTGLILALIFSHEYKHDVCSMSELCVWKENVPPYGSLRTRRSRKYKKTCSSELGSTKRAVLSLRYSLRSRHLD